MPVLPSGRRVEFSLDRFSAMLKQMPVEEALPICDALQAPDDLMYVLDVVHFDNAGHADFAGYMLADWEKHADGWVEADRSALRTHLKSDFSHASRAEALEAVKLDLLEHLLEPGEPAAIRRAA